ncbi:hypothetical protein [Nibricoccus sp. IMCC34717]|uniref:hypothetical protein n=1 Tax=Nibricoccus sp. IMCC34717 TaxID=3034021 RepID=UPI00384C350F
MRPFLPVILFIFAHSAAWASVSVVRVWPQYRDAASFERIGEFFTGKEQDASEPVLRSQPNARDGFYFLVRLSSTESAAQQVTPELRVILPDSPKVRVFTFPTLSLPSGKRVIHLGLTGSDWPLDLKHPVAWELSLVDSTGNAIAREASFLWSPP